MSRLAIALTLLSALLVPGCAGRRADDAPATSAPPPFTIPSCDGAWRKEPKIMPTPNDRPEDILFWVRRGVQNVPLDAYLEVQGQAQLEAAWEASRPHLGRWKPESNPYAPGRLATRCFHVGEAEGDRDVLRHRYETQGLKLDVFESAEIVLTWVDLPPVDPSAYLNTAQMIAAALFVNGATPLHIVPYRASDEDVRISTRASGALGVPLDNPYQIDGGIRGGRLFFILHKLDAALGQFRRALTLYPPPQGWLGTPLREAWSARAARP